MNRRLVDPKSKAMADSWKVYGEREAKNDSSWKADRESKIEPDDNVVERTQIKESTSLYSPLRKKRNPA